MAWSLRWKPCLRDTHLGRCPGGAESGCAWESWPGAEGTPAWGASLRTLTVHRGCPGRGEDPASQGHRVGAWLCRGAPPGPAAQAARHLGVVGFAGRQMPGPAILVDRCRRSGNGPTRGHGIDPPWRRDRRRCHRREQAQAIRSPAPAQRLRRSPRPPPGTGRPPQGGGRSGAPAAPAPPFSGSRPCPATASQPTSGDRRGGGRVPSGRCSRHPTRDQRQRGSRWPELAPGPAASAQRSDPEQRWAR